MAKIVSLACAHDQHDKCTNPGCECDCHKDTETLVGEMRQRRRSHREIAHHSVMVFDHNPNLSNTQAAILALQQYENTLKEQPHG